MAKRMKIAYMVVGKGGHPKTLDSRLPMYWYKHIAKDNLCRFDCDRVVRVTVTWEVAATTAKGKVPRG